MAVSSATSTTNIDVAGIVEQLMTVENRPLDVLKAKITQQNTVISDLGVIKGKVSTFQEALRAFQDPITFNSASASSTDTSVISVLAANGAIKGNYSLSVNSVALASKATVSGYTSATSLAGIDADAGFAITIGATTYNTKGTPAGTAVIGANPTVTDLKNWINSLGEDVSASVVQRTANQYSLMIQGTKTGTENAVTFTGLAPTGVVAAPSITTTPGAVAVTESAAVLFSNMLPGQTLSIAGLTFTAGTSGATAAQVVQAFSNLANNSNASAINASKGMNDAKGGVFSSGSLVDWSSGISSANELTFTSETPNTDVTNLSASSSMISSIAAQDASFSIDGTAFTRSTNSVSDVLNGVTLNLVKSSETAQTISITKGVDVSSAAINTLIKAYNELMSSYKEMTANSSNSSKPGTFANSPTALSFINQIKASFAKGISYTEGGTLKTMSLSTLGIDLQLDGTAKFNSTSFATASANGLQDVLALGVAAGYVDSSNNLNTFLTSQVKTGGALDLQIQSQNDSVRNLTKRQDDLQIRLNSVQNNLISQYSALNALLFQLNNTSTALTSALDALTNSQSNN